ncbi:hypothetical protein IVB18_38305 [Bradyrhizobium sp. 186]|uniref:hypothetical protein n=1 Tax=Bradyrhizobium sp. 186 TaxID=2782654 RepID=UPI002000D067|nr:hypothetical protein [Bradyrhizobium sp. 186]UPK33972.1 hypothetical protein IVB18_38305 [Bradyrhizobium sp. 186]
MLVVAPLHQAPIGGEVVWCEFECFGDVCKCCGCKAGLTGYFGAECVVACLGNGKDAAATVGEAKRLGQFAAGEICDSCSFQRSRVLLRIEQSCNSV